MTKSTKIVKQRADYDCALAVLAMVSGRDYDEIFDADFCARINERKVCTGDDLIEAYARAGFEKGKNLHDVYTGYGINFPILRQLIWGRRAMIQVPSLNYVGSEHMIYWNGKEVIDPSNKQTYKFLQSVFPTYVMIFDEIGLG